MSTIFILIFIGASFFLGAIVGYFTRFTLFSRNLFLLEKKVKEAEKKAFEILERAEKETKQREEDLSRRERFIYKKGKEIEAQLLKLDEEEKILKEKMKDLQEREAKISEREKEILKEMEKIAQMSSEEAKKAIFNGIEREYHREISERIAELERSGEEKFQKKARDILVNVIQRLAVPVTQESTTTTIFLPNLEIKGKIIGKEGRNIKTLEKLTGVEILFDEETPEVIEISAFDSVRRQIARLALEKLIKDGRIQPVKIEEKVREAEEEIKEQTKEAGEKALLDLGIMGIDPRLVQLLGRLKFRTSFGQNVLLHSIEVAYLAQMIADEIGANSRVAKIAGLFHDIGKALDHQVSGSHTQIGMKILEKFGIEKEVINAMKSHHEEFPFESVEAVIVQIADKISGARPGARKETVQEYVKRLEDLERIALSFPGVEKAWALEAGREIRVLVRPEEIDDFQARKLAKQIARKIEEELKYPGTIRVSLIRELRIIEYAR